MNVSKMAEMLKKHLFVSAVAFGLMVSGQTMARNGPSASIQATRTQVCGMQTSEPGIQQSDQTVVLLTVEAPNGFTDSEKKGARQKVMSQLPGSGKYLCITGMFFQDRGGVVKITTDERSK